jgi:hypothetical protein
LKRNQELIKNKKRTEKGLKIIENKTEKGFKKNSKRSEKEVKKK